MPEPILRLATDSGKSLPRKIAFTVKSLESLNCPAGRDRVYVYDQKTPGLAYVVTAKGARAFYLVRKVHGRAQRVRLGGREITIEQARKQAAAKNGEIARGGDPMAEKRAARASMTLQELFDKYTKEHADARSSERTRATDKNRFDTCLAGLKNRKLVSIHDADVRALHVELGRQRGHTTANRAMQLLGRLYNFAKIDRNPARRGVVNMFREKSRERFVQPDELPRLFAAIDHEETNPTIRDFLYMALFTGARRSNVAAMRDEEINATAATWSVPGVKSKNGEAMTLHLSAPAMAIVRQRMGHESGYIFPGSGRTGHLVEPKATWAAILKRAKLKNLHLHDLRRTLGSFQAALGASLPVIGRSLGHRNQATTAIYARLNLDPVRASVDAASGALVDGWAIAIDPATGHRADMEKKKTNE